MPNSGLIASESPSPSSLREALHRHLVRLASEVDADRWVQTPPSDDELSLAPIADWGPAEDWSDWADAAR